MSIDAMKQALEALEECIGYKTSPFMTRECEAAITALRAAIEQAKEPVAWMTHTKDFLPLFHETRKGALNWDTQPIPLYTAPRQWQGLTADEIWQCNAAPHESAVEYHICMAHQNVLDFAEAIEAKLKEKNA